MLTKEDICKLEGNALSIAVIEARGGTKWIQEVAGRALVHERLGLIAYDYGDVRGVMMMTDGFGRPVVAYATDIAAAWGLLADLQARGRVVGIKLYPSDHDLAGCAIQLDESIFGAGPYVGGVDLPEAAARIWLIDHYATVATPAVPDSEPVTA